MTAHWRSDVVAALAEVVEVLPQDLPTWMELPDVLLVDVREKEEYALGKIVGAIALPMSSFKEQALERLPVDKKLIFYCAGGVRSAVAAKWAKTIGFESVYSLQGGFKAWQEEAEAVRR